FILVTQNRNFECRISNEELRSPPALNRKSGGPAEVRSPRSSLVVGPSPHHRVARRRGALVAQIANHRRNIEVTAEIARRHRAESATAVGRLREAFSKK